GHRRFRIVGWQYLVLAVAIPAAGRLHVSESRNLSMECVAVGLFLVFVALAASGGSLHVPADIARAGDLMRGVAVRTDRRARVAHFQRLTVDARHVLPLRTGMAAPAGRRNISARSAARRIFAVEDPVRTMATGATGSDQEAVLG